MTRALFFCAFLIMSPFSVAAKSESMEYFLFQIPPLETKVVAEGAIEVRIIYQTGLTVGYSMLMLEHGKGKATATYFPFREDPEGAESVQVSPYMGWSQFWLRLEQSGLYTIPDESEIRSSRNDIVPMDMPSILVEVKQGKNFRQFSWYAPEYRSSPSAKQFSELLGFVQRSFRISLPGAR